MNWNLLFFCQSVAHNGRLYTERRVLCHWQMLLRGGQQRHAANLSQLERRLGVDGVENLFNGNDIGLPALQLCAKGLMYLSEPFWERLCFGKTYGAGRFADDSSQRTGFIRVHHAEPGNLGSTIDAENAHLFASLNPEALPWIVLSVFAGRSDRAICSADTRPSHLRRIRFWRADWLEMLLSVRSNGDGQVGCL